MWAPASSTPTRPATPTTTPPPRPSSPLRWQGRPDGHRRRRRNPGRHRRRHHLHPDGDRLLGPGRGHHHRRQLVLGVQDHRRSRELPDGGHLHGRLQPGRQRRLSGRSPGPADDHRRAGGQTITSPRRRPPGRSGGRLHACGDRLLGPDRGRHHRRRSSSVCRSPPVRQLHQAVGSCIVDANQAGNANYPAAPQVQQIFSVAKGSQTITTTSTAPTRRPGRCHLHACGHRLLGPGRDHHDRRQFVLGVLDHGRCRELPGRRHLHGRLQPWPGLCPGCRYRDPGVPGRTRRQSPLDDRYLGQQSGPQRAIRNVRFTAGGRRRRSWCAPAAKEHPWLPTTK